MVFLVESRAELFEQYHSVAVDARMLSALDHLLKDGVDIGHVEVATHQQVTRAPVVATQEGVAI